MLLMLVLLVSGISPAAVHAEGENAAKTTEQETAGKEEQTLETGEDDYKFRLGISSVDGEDTGAVVTTVKGDFTALVQTEGSSVNTGNVTFSVEMKDVASLHVSGTRSYRTTMNFTGTGRSVPMTQVQGILRAFEGKHVTVKNGSSAVKYTFAEKEAGAYAVTHDGNASTVWHSIVNDENLSSTTKDSDDSYAVLKNGFTLQAGNKILQFSGADDLRLDNLGELGSMELAVRNALELVDCEKTSENVVICLKKGSMLALGQSVLELKKDATIVISGVDAQEVADDLAVIRGMQVSGSNATALMKELLKLAAKYASAVENLVITFEFEGHAYGEPVWTWAEDGSAAKAAFTCGICGKTVELEADKITAEEDHGVITYTASVTLDGETYTDQKVIRAET